MLAKTIYVDPIDNGELIEINGHRLQFGGRAGDGYCYAHQDFDCYDKLTAEEWEAIENAEFTDEGAGDQTT